MKQSWLNIASWVLICGLFFVIWGFSASEQRALICDKMDIEVKVQDGMTFISKEDVERTLRSRSLDPTGVKFALINLGEIEDAVKSMKEVKTANAFKTVDGHVFVKVTQRKPVVRVFNANGTQFYLDEMGYQMPISDKYTPRVPVVSGFIHEPQANYSVKEIEESEVLRDQLLSDDIFRLAQFINKSAFWSAQIQEIYVNRQGEFELVPTLGDHRIIFGSLEHMKGKFSKLRIFYEEGLRNMSWERFSTINVKFKDQIVCTKKVNQ